MWPAVVGGATIVAGTAIALPVLALAAAQGGSFTQTLSEAVPAQYREALTSAAAECPGMPAAVLAAQAEVESGWNPAAVSPAGAMGIAQFMPGTWQTWGGDFDGDGDATPFDPEDALRAQARFMCALLDQARSSGFEGEPLELALAGYNAGWGAVVAYAGVPPYPETRAYVPKILARAADYAGPVVWSGAAAGDAVWPVLDPMPVTNPFWNHESNVGANYALDHHTGVDFNSPGDDLGMPVLAARGGIVVKTGRGAALGNEVVIKHADGLFSSYGHLNSIRVSSGDRVAAGALVGTIGSSGCNSCAPHLHFEVRRVRDWIGSPSIFLDPLSWLGLGTP